MSGGSRLSGYAAPTPPTAQLLYGAKGQTQTTSNLYTIDPVTAAGTSIGPIGFAITGLAFRPSDGVLFGATSGNSAASPRSLITINTATGAGTLVGALGTGITDIAFRSDDVLFGWSANTAKLYTIDTATGAATQVPTSTIIGSFGGGLTFDSTDTLLSFPNGSDGIWYIVDSATGGKTSQGTLSGYGVSDAIAAATCDENDVVYALVVFSVAVTSLVTIDTATDTVVQIAETEGFLDGLAWSIP